MCPPWLWVPRCPAQVAVGGPGIPPAGHGAPHTRPGRADKVRTARGFLLRKRKSHFPVKSSQSQRSDEPVLKYLLDVSLGQGRASDLSPGQRLPAPISRQTSCPKATSAGRGSASPGPSRGLHGDTRPAGDVGGFAAGAESTSGMGDRGQDYRTARHAAARPPSAHGGREWPRARRSPSQRPPRTKSAPAAWRSL